MSDVIAQIEGRMGCITLNRPKALNALSLDMVRQITLALLDWQNDAQVLGVAVRGMGKEGPFSSFCAGGDIRFFHQAALAGDPKLEDFFTEEYRLNHLIHTYPKPYIAFMDGIVMGGGMGISQGASVRVVTERTKMAMPETNIGLFPDVGGGYFLSRCTGHLGEYLGLTGEVLQGEQGVLAGLADGYMVSGKLPHLWQTLIETPFENSQAIERWLETQFERVTQSGLANLDEINFAFAETSVMNILTRLETMSSPWSQKTLQCLRKRSPLMLNVALLQIRKARSQSLADTLRMERDLMRHAFNLHPTLETDAVEGIRALVIEKDHSPKWNPARAELVGSAQVDEFFRSPWPSNSHPLRDLH